MKKEINYPEKIVFGKNENPQPENLYKEEVFIISACILVLIGLISAVFLVVRDINAGINSNNLKAKQMEVIKTANVFVLNKLYIPRERLSTISGNFHVSTNYLLIIKDQENKIFEIDDLQLWGQVEKGDSAIVTYNNIKGPFEDWHVKFYKIKKFN